MRTHITNLGRLAGAGLLAGLVAAGCGGGAKSGPGANVAKTSAGTEIVTDSGARLTVEAHNHWLEGLKKFARYEKEGWNESRCEDAIDSFEEAVDAQADGKFAEAQYMSGLTASRCNDADEARSYYEKALDTNPKLCKARVAIGVMTLKSGDEKKAFGIFRKAVSDDARCTEGYVNLAIMERTMGADKVDDARKNLRRALAIESQYLPAFNELALLFFEQGAKKREQLDLAEVVCRQAQLLDAEYAPIYNTWGLIKMRKGDIIAALRFFEKARALDSSIFEAHMNFGAITLSFRGYEDAQNSFAKAVQLRPSNYEAHLGLGVAYRGLEQVDKAEAQYKKAIEIDGRRADAYFNLAVLYHNYKSGLVPDLNKAKGYYKQFLKRAGRSREYRETVESVTRRCRKDKKGRKRDKSCRPGSMQNLEDTIAALREMEQMQKEAAEMQRQMEQQQQ